ncbi:MAG: SPFH domain-containing protein [Candidatus Dormibacteria bacterium]|jgi:regulator of protease activity HflC (stomatin/prohibitin superfamily)
MADITSVPGLRHLRGSPTGHVRHLRRGRVVHEGTGQSFWFRPLNAVLSEIPVDDRELPLLFHARTADFQDLSVQVTVTFRVTDPALASTRVDFSIDPGTGRLRGAPLEQLGSILTESAQQYALSYLTGAPLAVALADGVAEVGRRLERGLSDDRRLAETGISVVDVRVVAIRPDPEVEKALQTPTREQLQQEADRAMFERRALAVERERAISENEMHTRIELAKREEQLVTQRGANARRQAEDEADTTRIQSEAAAAQRLRLAEAQAAGARALGAAHAASEAARLAAYREVSEATLLGLAMKELAANLPKIQSLVLTPDLIAPLLARLGATPMAAPTATAAAEAAEEER